MPSFSWFGRLHSESFPSRLWPWMEQKHLFSRWPRTSKFYQCSTSETLSQHSATHQDHRFNPDLWDGSPILCRYTILFRTFPTEEFSQKGVLKVVLTICSKFTGQHLSWSVISTKLLCNYIEITLPQGCFLVNLLRIVRTTFPKNTSEGLVLSAAESGRPS